MQTEAIAPTLNSGAYGNYFGYAMNPSAKITDKSTFPIQIATMYPTARPTNTESCFKYPFDKQFHSKHTPKVIVPRIRFCEEPKSSVYPPPKDLAPTVKREKPIAVTTVAATIGEIILLQYFASRPKVPSKMPPIRTAPITVGYP